MARELKRGEIWLYPFKPPDKRRPVLIVSRQAAIRFLRTLLHQFIGTVDAAAMRRVCRAVAVATGCA